MVKNNSDVQKSDIGFWTQIKQLGLNASERLNVKSSRTKTTFRGYGLNFSRETETKSGSLDQCEDHEGR